MRARSGIEISQPKLKLCSAYLYDQACGIFSLDGSYPLRTLSMARILNPRHPWSREISDLERELGIRMQMRRKQQDEREQGLYANNTRWTQNRFFTPFIGNISKKALDFRKYSVLILEVWFCIFGILIENLFINLTQQYLT